MNDYLAHWQKKDGTPNLRTASGQRIQRRMDETIRKELEIVQKAQANIDRLVKGGGRLPPVAPKETSETLIVELKKWRMAQGFTHTVSHEMCAVELMHRFDMTPEQSTWIVNFMKRWDSVKEVA